MNPKNHHVLFGSAVTKWRQFLITVLEIRTSRGFPKRFKLAGTFQKVREGQNRVGEKMWEKVPTGVESKDWERCWTSGTSGTSGSGATLT